VDFLKDYKEKIPWTRKKDQNLFSSQLPFDEKKSKTKNKLDKKVEKF